MTASVPDPHPIVKKTRACIPCHERKVRCDSGSVGVPCSRCISKSRTGCCVLLRDMERRNNKRKRDAGGSSCFRPEQGHEPSNEGQYSTSDALNGNFSPFRLGPTTPQSLSDSAHTTERHSFQHSIGQHPVQNERANLNGGVLHRERETGVREGEQSGPTSEDCAVAEEDAQLQTFRQMSRGNTISTSHTTLSVSGQGRQVIEYYGRLNSITILGEVLGQQQRKRLIRIVVLGPEALTVKQKELTGLEPADIRYLNEKGVHEFPPRSVCDEMLRIFFECIYPYAPVLDRVEFVTEYDNENCSTFLLQCIFANVVPYAPSELLHRAGYLDRPAAQRSFSSKAKLLFDLGCEKGQLSMLQGSILLSSVQSSVGPDKDFRFWFHNAIRIATQMGLHRENLGEDLDPAAHKLCRKIWWIVYQRDVLLSVSGFENARRIFDGDSDTRLPGEDDWEDEHLTQTAEKYLLPFTRLHKLYFIEYCKLSMIGAQFLRLFRSPGPPVSVTAAYELADAISNWRSLLPVELLCDRVIQWSKQNFWILVLRALSYRLECMFYRELKMQVCTTDNDAFTWAAQRLLSSISELDIVMQRILTHKLDKFCPASILICASTVLALQVEVALDSATTEPEKLIAKAHIHAGVSYLRSNGENWPNAKWALRVFETVVLRPDLSLTQKIFNTAPADRCNDNNSSMPQHEDESVNRHEQSFQTGTVRPQERFEGLPNDWIHDLLDSSLLDSSFLDGQDDHFLDLRPLM